MFLRLALIVFLASWAQARFPPAGRDYYRVMDRFMQHKLHIAPEPTERIQRICITVMPENIKTCVEFSGSQSAQVTVQHIQTSDPVTAYEGTRPRPARPARPVRPLDQPPPPPRGPPTSGSGRRPADPK